MLAKETFGVHAPLDRLAEVGKVGSIQHDVCPGNVGVQALTLSTKIGGNGCATFGKIIQRDALAWDNDGRELLDNRKGLVDDLKRRLRIRVSAR